MHYFKKLFGVLVVLLSVSSLSFILANISTIEPAEAIARHIYTNPTEEQIHAIRHEKGLDHPIHIQYMNWVSNALKGDLGTSYQTEKPVIEEMPQKLLATLSLVGMAFIWIVLLTIPLSIASIKKKNGLIDHFIRGVTILGISLPTFWLGFILLTALAVSIPIFKVVDYGNLKSLILPSIAMAVPVICSSVRILRTTLLENLKSDYVIYAKARGLSENEILYKHVLKNALPPIVTLFFQNIGMMIGTSAIVESVFSWPGLGNYFVHSIMNRDLPVITACVLILGFIFVASNGVGEVVNRLLNPNLKSKAKEVGNV